MRSRQLSTGIIVLAVVLFASAAFIGSVHASSNTPVHADEVNNPDEYDGTEIIGCWGNVCYDDELNVNDEDRISEDELTDVVHRSMSRVEYIREEPFDEEVEVSVMTRDELDEIFAQQTTSEEERAYENEKWKAMFTIGEDTDVLEEREKAFGASVQGFYAPTDNEVVLVVPDDSTDEFYIDGTTLFHELGHALQDQRHGLIGTQLIPETHDEDLAIDGVVEGEVVYMEREYERYCETEWDCIGSPESDGSDIDINQGLFLNLFFPYSEGPEFAQQEIEEQGWDRVDELLNDPPESSKTIIHNEEHSPPEIDYEPVDHDEWGPFTEVTDNAETVGEAGIYTMFWHQSREYGAATFDWQEVMTDGDAIINYEHESSDGWENDELHIFREPIEGETGYVWVTQWETQEDAELFAETYYAVLDAHTDDLGGHYHEVTDGPFTGTYVVEHEEDTVMIVHGPDEEATDILHPDIEQGDDVGSDGDAETNNDETDQPTDPDDDNTTIIIVGVGMVLAVGGSGTVYWYYTQNKTKPPI